ncbi:UPF0739 protein C1orf74 homolog [Babylonia areolata]|uniref:UPF0739 protein C1orf74 homolog n=1 Tax=Babylonia areolata TaxID=304850 RepID=UPI003FCFB1A1
MDHSKWRQVIGQHLGRRQGGQRWRSLMEDLRCVDCGLKPALLLDFAVSTPTCLPTLLTALTSAALLSSHLTVVTIGVDVLIVNIASFSGLMDSCPKKPFSDVMYVDVSSGLDCPQLLSDSKSSGCLQGTRNSFLSVLEELGSGSSVDVPLTGVEGSQRPNPSTLFGLFLGYPVVYYYDMSVDSADNCLSWVPLVNFVLKGRACGIRERGQCPREHVVCSFTVPQALVEEAEGRVAAWFKDKRDCALGCKLFDELDLERRVVQLPSVCL